MAKTALFSRLQRVMSRFAAPSLALQSQARSLSRRRLLQAGAGLAVLGCGPESGQAPLTPSAPKQRVAVIGGGLAGLHCAFRLAQAGTDVTVYEANARVGGRAFTGRRLFRDAKLTCEFGAEFIDADHVTMRALAEEFGIFLDGRYDGVGNIELDSYWLGGKYVAAESIERDLEAVSPAILAALSAAEGDASVFRDLDNTTLSSFFDQHVPADEYPELSALFQTAFRGEFGLEPDEQSALNLVHLLVPGDEARLVPFGLREGQQRARAGNDAFATAFAAALRDRVKLNSKLTSIRPSTSGAGTTLRLTFETQTASGFVAEAEHVVFAIPFSVLRQLDLSALTLSEPKLKLINELGYGTHSKMFGAFVRRAWRDPEIVKDSAGNEIAAIVRSGTISTDLPFQQVWDASIGQGDSQSGALLGNLLSGKAGENADTVAVQDSMLALLAGLRDALPSTSASFISGSARRVHWPSAPLFRGSASAYFPGQWALRGNEGKREGNLHFCGEHCSPDFQGRMEGAAETGALVAARLLDDLHVAWPSALAQILAPKLVVEQPCYHGTVGAKLGFLTRRATLAREALPGEG
jgi:monoamine oxidase